MGAGDSSRRPSTNSGNIPGGFEICKSVRSGGAASAASTANFAGFSFAVVLCATNRGKSRSGMEQIPILTNANVLKKLYSGVRVI